MYGVKVNYAKYGTYRSDMYTLFGTDLFHLSE